MKDLYHLWRSRVLMVGICCCIALALFASMGMFREHRSRTPAELNAHYWEESIRALGPVRAYAELAEDVSLMDPSAQHGVAHAFGAALYSEEGIRGFAVCDTRFFYGCFHEFIGRAIIDQGLGVVETLDRSCANDTIGCQHGIGHGILAYLGYSQKNLTKALEICASLADDNALQGCDAGVYMEYNLQTMAQSATSTHHPVRAPGPGGMYAPCDALPLAMRTVCYQWQPQWWWVYFTETKHIDPDGAFKQMALLCGKVADAQSRAACVEGTGLMAAAAANYDPHRSAALCDVSFASESDRLMCRAYAADVYSNTRTSAEALLVCDGLTGVQEEYCRSYAEGAASISKPRPLPTL